MFSDPLNELDELTALSEKLGLYQLQPAPPDVLDIVCISDTHGIHEQLQIPPCHLLLFSGDWSAGKGNLKQTEHFLSWLSAQPANYKVLIAGNHDFTAENMQGFRSWVEDEFPGVIYLKDSSTSLYGLNIYGYPWQHWFFDWAFKLPRNGASMERKWKHIPGNTDILITHGPPHKILDRCASGNVGCEKLSEALERDKHSRLKLHLFGHIHEGRGHQLENSKLYVNASCLDGQYRMLENPVTLLKWEERRAT